MKRLSLKVFRGNSILKMLLCFFLFSHLHFAFCQEISVSCENGIDIHLCHLYGNKLAVCGFHIADDNSVCQRVIIPSKINWEGTVYRVIAIDNLRIYDFNELIIPKSIRYVKRNAIRESSQWFRSLPYGLVYLGKALYKVKGIETHTDRLLERELLTSEYQLTDILANLDSIQKEETLDSMDISMLDEINSFQRANPVPYIDFEPSFRMFTYTNIGKCRIKKGTKSISSEAFNECKNVIEVYLPNSIDSIGTAAFYRCKDLKYIHLPKRLHTIATNMFMGCSNLKKIEIPKSVNRIEAGAFAYCALEFIYVNWHKPIDIGSSVFKGCQLSTCTLIVPRGTRQLYEQAEGWKDFGRIVEE